MNVPMKVYFCDDQNDELCFDHAMIIAREAEIGPKGKSTIRMEVGDPEWLYGCEICNPNLKEIG